MPILGFLHIAIAVFFAVHAVRTGRPMYWIMILIIAPFIGSVIYFFAEYLPEMRHSTVARKSVSVVKSIVDPNRELREARLAVERTPTVDNRSRLAEALLARGDNDEAIEQFQACASGPYSKDVKFRRGLARAQLAAGRDAAAAATLESLIADAPRDAGSDATLWLAQALTQVDEARALAAFEEASRLHNTTETQAAYGIFLASLGRDAQARPLLEGVLHNARVGTPSSRELNRASIDQARAALKAVEARGG
ncbi:MAG: tetratricopeptide repeat protein [Betaproteobacteria bacterium]